MELILIRHGRPERVDHDPAGADPGLTELGHRQAKGMAEFLGREPIASLYVSPQRRARETAIPLAGALAIEPTVVDEVAEFDIGHPSYIPGDEAGPMTAAELQQLLDAVTAAAFRERVLGAVNRVVDANPGRTSAIVCHGGVISTVLGDVLGTPPEVYYDSDYTSITRIRASRSGRRSMASFNERHWLREL